MNQQYERIALLFGEEKIEELQKKTVAVFGVGGVGGYVVEALARSGIGSFVFIDNDTVSITNLNRQIIATHATIGRSKVEVMKERVLSINPEAKIETYQTFFLPETADLWDFTKYDYIVDAIDTVAGKIELVVKAEQAGTPIISSMGAGNKIDPTRFEVADIYKTSVCPLAKVMRHELRKRNVAKLKVVYSKEEPLVPQALAIQSNKRTTPGSVAFVPSVVGLIIAGEIIKDLIRG